MKTMEDFTPEIQAKIPEYIKKATDGVFDGKMYENFNIKDAELAVNWNYEKCGYKKPVVIVAENPYEQQIMFNYIKSAEHLHPILNKLFELNNSDGDNTTMKETLMQEFLSGIKIDKSVINNKDLKTHNNSYLFTLNVYSNAYYYFYKFIKDEFNLPLTIEKEFEECFALQRKSGVYSAIFSEALCVVCKYPKLVHRNANNLLHNTKGVAVEWGYSNELTKFNCFYINGRNISSEIFLKTLNKELTAEEFINEENEDIKAGIYEIIGEQNMMEFLNTEVVDKQTIMHSNGELEELELIKTKNTFKELENKPLAWIKFKCPSTGSHYHIATNPDFTNVVDSAKFHRPFGDLTDLEYKWNFRS